MNRIKNSLDIKDQIIAEKYWEVNRSGKVLEFRVIPNIDLNPLQYRLGVIQIGRILYRIKSLLTHKSTKPRIQLFPNFSENQLAATIYWPELLSADFRSEPGNEKKKCSLSLVQTLSNKYSLILKKRADCEKLLKKQGESCYSIFSVSNQPFIWLKLGQFIEELKLVTFNDPKFSPEDVVLLNADQILDKSGDEEKNYYLQVLIKLPD